MNELISLIPERATRANAYDGYPTGQLFVSRTWLIPRVGFDISLRHIWRKQEHSIDYSEQAKMLSQPEHDLRQLHFDDLKKGDSESWAAVRL